MSSSALPRGARARRRLAVVGLAIALPLTTAAGCQEGSEDEGGMQEEEEEGGSEDGGSGEDDD